MKSSLCIILLTNFASLFDWGIVVNIKYNKSENISIFVYGGIQNPHA